MDIFFIIGIIIGIIIGAKLKYKIYEIIDIIINKFKKHTLYVIQTTYSNNTISSIGVEAFCNREKAVKFIEEKLTEEEKQDNINKKKQGLLWNDEFLCKNVKYTIYQLNIMDY